MGRSRRIEQPCKSLRTRAKAGSSPTLLAVRAAKRGGAYQGFPRVGPAVRMSVTGMIIVPKAFEPRGQCCHTAQTASGQTTSVSDAQEPLGLLAPRVVFGRAMQDLPRAGIAPACRALQARAWTTIATSAEKWLQARVLPPASPAYETERFLELPASAVGALGAAPSRSR